MPIGMQRRLKDSAKRALLSTYEIGLKAGVIVLPKHYYVPIPDLHELRRTKQQWARRSEMIGVHMDVDSQVDFLRRTVKPFEPEYRGNTAFKLAVNGGFGPGFGYIEAQALHGIIRGLRPKNIIEIGSGVSTYCMTQASVKNAAEGSPTTVTCIEPYPSEWLRSAAVNLITSRVQNIDLSFFHELDAGDMLFIDSTHTVKTGSDVNLLILEILPRLKSGVIVHFHDIYFPYDFQPDVDHQLFHWMESALLHAFLAYNSKFKILVCLSHLHHDRPEQLREVFPEYARRELVDGLYVAQNSDDRHFPASIYLKVV